MKVYKTALSTLFVLSTWVSAGALLSSCDGLDSSASDPATLGSVSGNPSTATPTDPVEATPVPSFYPSDSPQSQVFAQTNAFRVSNGVPPLTENPQLTESAQKFAESMAALGFFSHTAPDGSSPGDRIKAAGYDFYTWGENIAYGYSTADQTMQGWINSAGHRANLLNKSFKEIGIGYFVKKTSSGSAGTAYWVQDFGAQ